MSPPHPLRSLAVLLPGLAALVVQAQTPPDAGRLLQQNELRRLPLPERSSSPLPDTTPTPLPSGGRRLLVKRFVFEGNQLLDSNRLQLEVQDATGQALTLADLRAVTARVVRLYASEGWLVRCELPPQDVTDGIVRLQVIEARFGGVRLEGSARHPGEALLASQLVQAQQAVGLPLALSDLERGLMLANDLPGLSVGGSLLAGEHEGETLLALQLRPTPLVSGDAGLDNSGSRSTGEVHASASVTLHSALGLGELAAGSLNHSRGSDFLSVTATLPMGLQGWRLGMQASALRYRLVGADFAALQASGDSTTWGLTASYPLVRGRDRNLLLRLQADERLFDNRSQGGTTSHYRVRRLTTALDGNRYDDWLGGGVTTANLGLDAGRVNLEGSPNFAADAATAHTHGRTIKLRYALGRQQQLAGPFSAAVNLVGQWANRNLDSSEKFYLGGAYGVRAYPASEAGGSRGQLASVELRATVSDRSRLGLFYDWGRAQNYADAGFPGAPARNTSDLKGAGLNLSWSGPGALQLQATLARRIGSNANAGPTGLDQDGTLKRNRLWLQATLPF